MRFFWWTIIRIVPVCTWLIGVSPAVAQAKTITVYAAASLTSVLQDLVKESGVEVKSSFGSSSSLARQIEQGAPADVYISANEAWMDYLESRSLIEKGTRIDLLGNSLVIIAPKGEGFRVESRRGFDFAKAFRGRLTLGDPSHVPAGIYARQALRWLGWWEALEGRLVPALDVRAALAYVEWGECAAGVVYMTDAVADSNVEVIATLPDEAHDRIVYPVAVVKGRSTERVRRFIDLLRSENSGKLFQKYGFIVLK
ncbi:MAG: molybdate ABC transporter substrate-binding protein [Candidatus Latescibacteria bacterium]|nr:molybdate ABC transporter substrate-binding protein [Candidatus Latescibacterota bacterium]